MTHKLLLHVGAPKTGTSFVQDLLFHNPKALAEQGFVYPADRFDAHFLAALDLMELPWGGLEKQAVGAWDRLAEQIRDEDRTVIVSHEILAAASRPQVRRAMESFGDTEVHLVLSARDLVRQIPAEWQENVKHRRTIGYREFLDTIMDPERSGKLASWFWSVQEVPAILDRWGESLPPERVHLVTVPPPGAPSELLWQRFAGVLGLDPAPLERGGGRANPSLGVPEIALIRRVNGRVNHGVLGGDPYRALVRELVAHRTLSARTGSPRLYLPEDAQAWATDLSKRWVAALSTKGYDVVGDLAELQPAPTGPFVDPDAPDEGEVADAALDTIVALLQHEVDARRAGRDRERALREEVEVFRRERDEAWERFYGRASYRARQRLVRAADRSRLMALLLRGYRRARGRSSRSA